MLPFPFDTGEREKAPTAYPYKSFTANSHSRHGKLPPRRTGWIDVNFLAPSWVAAIQSYFTALTGLLRVASTRALVAGAAGVLLPPRRASA
jgi:hypothetical protein